MSLCFMLFADHAEWQGIAEKSDLSYSQVTDNEKQWFGPQNRADTPLPGQTPSPGEHPPDRPPPETATGTHPTGMHSCY